MLGRWSLLLLSLLPGLGITAEPTPPTVTYIAENSPLATALSTFRQQTGVTVRTSSDLGARPFSFRLDRVPFWTALDQVAAQSKSRVTFAEQGREIVLVPATGEAQVPRSDDRVFRTILRQVQSRVDFDSGQSFTEFTLDLHWPASVPVFRLDVQPRVTSLSVDGTEMMVPLPPKTRIAPIGAQYTTTIRAPRIPRSAKSVAVLAGTLTATVSPRMLQFRFNDLTASRPVAAPDQEQVSARILPVRAIGDQWEVGLELQYPPLPEFETFESWVTENRLQLIGPDGRVYQPSDSEIPEQGRRVVAYYRFPARGPQAIPLTDRTKWSAIYTTPAPLTELPLQFRFQEVPLP